MQQLESLEVVQLVELVHVEIRTENLGESPEAFAQAQTHLQLPSLSSASKVTKDLDVLQVDPKVFLMQKSWIAMMR